MTPLDEVRAKLLTPRLRGGQRIRLGSTSMLGELIAPGPDEGQATIVLDDWPHQEFVVDAARITITEEPR